MHILDKVKLLNHECLYVLMSYIDFLDKDKTQMQFAVDNEELHSIIQMINEIHKLDDRCKVLVCAYLDELVDSAGIKFVYADSLWIISDITQEELETLLESNCGEVYPSDISNYSSIKELIDQNIMIAENRDSIMEFKQSEYHKYIENVKVLYWD